MISPALNCKLSGLSILVPISCIWVQEKKRKILRHVLYFLKKKFLVTLIPLNSFNLRKFKFIFKSFGSPVKSRGDHRLIGQSRDFPSFPR
jgi:hypothetical protein